MVLSPSLPYWISSSTIHDEQYPYKCYYLWYDCYLQQITKIYLIKNKVEHQTRGRWNRCLFKFDLLWSTRAGNLNVKIIMIYTDNIYNHNLDTVWSQCTIRVPLIYKYLYLSLSICKPLPFHFYIYYFSFPFLYVKLYLSFLLLFPFYIYKFPCPFLHLLFLPWSKLPSTPDWVRLPCGISYKDYINLQIKIKIKHWTQILEFPIEIF